MLILRVFNVMQMIYWFMKSICAPPKPPSEILQLYRKTCSSYPYVLHFSIVSGGNNLFKIESL